MIQDFIVTHTHTHEIPKHVMMLDERGEREREVHRVGNVVV